MVLFEDAGEYDQVFKGTRKLYIAHRRPQGCKIKTPVHHWGMYP